MTRAALNAVRGRAVDLAEPHRVGLVYSQQRERSVLAVIERLCAERRRPIQAGLFDQRAIRMALARRAEADDLIEAALTGVEASGPAHIHLAGDPALLLVLAVTE
jgi:hypothetical protein